MKVLIVEDEYNARQYLKTILLKLAPNTDIVDQIDSVEDAVNWFHQNEAPDLVFLDIQLSDGLSFEIFKHVQVKSPIIFTTAFDQYAIDAFKVNSIDYLLKPIHINDLQQALDKFDQHYTVDGKDLTEQLKHVFSQLNPPKKHRCLVKKGNHFEFINISDIALVESSEGMTFLHHFDGKRFLYANTIEGLMQSLDERSFFQINRGQIINIKAIDKIHPYFNQRLKVELSGPNQSMELIVSRAKSQIFKNWLDA